MKKVLVTGAGGFIGHRLVRTLLESGFMVNCFLRYTSSSSMGLLETLPEEMKRSINCFYGDIRNPEIVRKAMEDCDTVFHLAALIGIPYSYQCPSDVVSVNIGGTLNVLNSALETGAQVVSTSTSEVYGSAMVVPMTESHPLNAQSPYAASKTGADQLTMSYHAAFGLPAVVCRPFNTFGPGQSQRAVIPSILAQALFADEVVIGSTFPTRDFTFVDDTAAAFIAIAESSKTTGRVVHFGTGREISIGDLAKLAAKAAHREGITIRASDPSRVRPGSSEVTRLVASSELALELTGWKPRVSLEEGLEITADWIKTHPSHYRLRGYRV